MWAFALMYHGLCLCWNMLTHIAYASIINTKVVDRSLGTSSPLGEGRGRMEQKVCNLRSRLWTTVKSRFRNKVWRWGIMDQKGWKMEFTTLFFFFTPNEVVYIVRHVNFLDMLSSTSCSKTADKYRLLCHWQQLIFLCICFHPSKWMGWSRGGKVCTSLIDFNRIKCPFIHNGVNTFISSDWTQHNRDVPMQMDSLPHG